MNNEQERLERVKHWQKMLREQRKEKKSKKTVNAEQQWQMIKENK